MRRPRPPGDVDAVDVLLVEDDEDQDVAADHVRAVLHELALEAMAWRATWPGEPERLTEPDPPAAPVEVSLARRLVIRYRRRAVVLAVLAVVVATTVAVVDARRTAARLRAFAATPTVLAEVSGPPTVAWRAPGRVVRGPGDRLLVIDGTSLRAVDPATGEVLWTAEPAAGRAASTGGCFPVDESLLPHRAPIEDAGPGGLVACVDGGVGSPPPGGATAGARVVVVDSATGRIRHTLATDGGVLLAEPVGRDLLVAAARADGRVAVTRWDLTTGAPRWHRLSPRPVATPGVEPTVERRPTTLTVGAFAVHLTSGEERDAADESRRPYPYGEATLPGGRRATWAWRPDGTFGQGRVSGDVPGSSYLLPGVPLQPAVTDDSHAGVLVVRTGHGERLRGLNLRTGRMTWTRPFPTSSSLTATGLVDGVLLLEDGATVVALDVRTGDSLWRVPVGLREDGAALTDGQVVLIPVRADDGALRLIAYRATDGAPQWSTSLPAGTVSLTVVDHHLVAATDDEVVGLG